jgi:hypothetical protein
MEMIFDAPDDRDAVERVAVSFHRPPEAEIRHQYSHSAKTGRRELLGRPDRSRQT